MLSRDFLSKEDVILVEVILLVQESKALADRKTVSGRVITVQVTREMQK